MADPTRPSLPAIPDELVGHVTPGDHPWVWRTPTWTVHKIAVSTMHNNVYLLTCTRTGEQALVDAADDAPAIESLLRTGTGRLDLLVTTHQHWDHHRALAEVSTRHTPVTAAGADDADALPVEIHRRLAHGATLHVGELTLSVIVLRGHTPGSVALALPSVDGPTALFTGDALFPGGPGKTGSPAHFTSLLGDLQERVFDPFADDAVVLPGHGDNTVLGRERPQLPGWRARGW